jgi:hypothetical protein
MDRLVRYQRALLEAQADEGGSRLRPYAEETDNSLGARLNGVAEARCGRSLTKTKGEAVLSR